MIKPGTKLSESDLEALMNSGEVKVKEEVQPKIAIVSEEQEVLDNLKSINASNNIETTSCPCCGWLLSQSVEVSPTKEDIDNFVISVLGNTRFTKTYTIFGGKVLITLRSRLASETELIIEQLNAEKIGKLLNSQHLAATLIKYQLVMCLDSIGSVGSSTTSYPTIIDSTGNINSKYIEKDTPAIIVAANKNFNQWNDALYNACLKVQTQFEQLISVLTSRATDPNFW